jgi:hypothetical protein
LINWCPENFATRQGRLPQRLIAISPNWRARLVQPRVSISYRE